MISNILLTLKDLKENEYVIVKDNFNNEEKQILESMVEDDD